SLSENYLEQLFALLKKNGLIKSVRGAQGGYILGREPGEISVGEVLRALEGSLAPVECVMENDPTQCNESDYCVTRLIWERMRDKINEAVDSITLDKLIEDYYKLNNKNI
ncbi:MAG TPA: Rrf2 family transcriptional regulator, partial [Clostridia bacterium]|nr:Rrf2 family transcriptional regulator [Clostridia bacterium]